MATALANQRPRRLDLPPLTDEQQVLFSFDDDFPKDQRKPEAERVLAARRREKETRVVVPAGMHVHVRERADLPWHPIEPLRRGQPPKVPAGTWEDDDQLVADVRDIIGRRDERAELDPEAYADLKRLAEADRVLGRQLRSDEETILRRLCYGTGDQPAQPRRVRGRRRVDDDDPVRPEQANDIARQLLVWRHHLTDPDVRRMQASRRKGRPRVKMIFG